MGISLALWTLGKGQESSRGKKLIYISIRSKSPSLSALPPPKKAAQEGTHSHCGIQEYPKDMVQLSSPLLCCLPLAQNLSGISLEFMSAKKKISKFSLPWSAAPCALLSTWKTRKQHLTLKRPRVVLGCLPALGAASSLDTSYSPNPNGLGTPGNSLQDSGTPSRDKPHPSSGFVLFLFAACGRTARPRAAAQWLRLLLLQQHFCVSQPFPNHCWSNYCHRGCREGDSWS